ncbi:MAG: PAS domain S-box protein [Melioribacter sp.]|nr:PAS domain S-box protein [Melioribacter sp.]
MKTKINSEASINKKLFEKLFATHPLPVLVCERKSLLILNANQTTVRKYGYGKNKLLKMRLTELYPPKNLDVLRKKNKINGIHQHKTISGKVIDVEITSSKVNYEGKESILLIFHDVTEQNKLKNKLIESEAELRTTLYSIGDGVITTNDKGKILFMNPVAERLTGWKEKEAKGLKLDKVFNVVNESTHKKVENPVKRVLREGVVVGLANHTVLISKDGKERPIIDCGAPIKDKKGNIKGVILVFRDQTKEREAQRKIEEAKIFSESIIATLREPFVVLNSKMEVISANNSFYSTFKTTPKQTIGKLLYKLGNKQWDIPKLRELLESIIPRNTSFENFEVEQEFPAIGKRTMLLNARKIYKETNKTEMILLAFEDITERKKAEEELKQILEMYYTLIESTDDSIYMVDKNCNYLHMNKKYLSRLGRKLEDVIGKSYGEFHTADGTKDFQEKVSKVCNTGTSIIYEYKSFRDGRYFIRTLSPVKDSITNETIAVTIISKDITQQKEVERALRESEEKFRKLAESTHTAIFMYKGSNFIYANKATIELLGYSEEELLNMNFWDVVHPDYKELIKERGLARQKGKPVLSSYDFKVITKTGEEKWVTFTSTLIDYKGEAIALGTAFDITERKIAEEKLKESEERFRNIYESLTIGVYRTTPDGKLLMANPTFLNMLGYESLEEAQSKIIMDEVYVEKGTRDLFLKIILEEGYIYGFEQKWKRADGKIIYIRENARAYKDKNGNISYFEGTAEDITTKKLGEEELLKAKEKAEQADRLKTYFLAQMSHEIRTPLNVIVSFNNLIKEEIKDKISPELEDSFNSVELATRRIIKTIDMILNMSALQSGTYETFFKLINIKDDVFIPLENEFKIIAQNKSLDFVITYNASDLQIYADEYSVKQLFSNLIDNAIKYTSKGCVEIIVSRNEMNKLTVEVKDTGIGISEEFLPKLFQPFTQEDQGYTRRFEGSGLGLALVKKYCEINNAQISVESTKGVGTTFTVIFN